MAMLAARNAFFRKEIGQTHRAIGGQVLVHNALELRTVRLHPTIAYAVIIVQRLIIAFLDDLIHVRHQIEILDTPI